MSQNLLISGKKYLPSAEIALSFGYTSDYVSRLAREGKIDATNVNRKWFICQESFEEFVRNIDLVKETRSDALKKQRRVDRLMHEQDSKKNSNSDGAHAHIAIAQTCAILLCGAIVGLLGWSASGAGITPAELTLGIEKTYIQIAHAIKPNQNPFLLFSEWSGVASVQESFTQEGGVLTDMHNSSSQEETQSVTKEAVVPEQYSSMPFSDEVDVRFVDDGTGVVRPVFKNRMDGQEYQMLLAPVTEGG